MNAAFFRVNPSKQLVVARDEPPAFAAGAGPVPEKLRHVPSNWTQALRQIHRWLSIVFTASVIFTTIALAQERPAVWASYAPLFPLALLALTGLYLFVQPYARRRSGSRTRG